MHLYPFSFQFCFLCFNVYMLLVELQPTAPKETVFETPYLTNSGIWKPRLQNILQHYLREESFWWQEKGLYSLHVSSEIANFSVVRGTNVGVNCLRIPQGKERSSRMPRLSNFLTHLFFNALFFYLVYNITWVYWWMLFLFSMVALPGASWLIKFRIILALQLLGRFVPEWKRHETCFYGAL